MNILFISNLFVPPDKPGLPRPYRVAKYLQSKGHGVTVITNCRHYLNEDIMLWNCHNKTMQVVDQIKIIAVKTTKGRRKSLFRRLLNYFSFSFMAYKVGFGLQKQDIILTSTPPLIVPLISIFLGKKHQAPTVLDIGDLYPETAVALGKLKNKAVISLWERWENMLRGKHDHIVACVPYIHDKLLSKGFDPAKITTITNGYDMESEEGFCLPKGLETVFLANKDKFIVTYGGVMGYGVNLMTVFEAAKKCVDDNKIVFMFFGDGEKKSDYENYIKEKRLANCMLFSSQPKRIINEIFRRSSALIHSYYDDEFFECALPNKLFDYHGSGRPILFAGKGDSAKLIEEAGSGIVIPPEKPELLADAIRSLASDPERAATMGLSGKEYIVKHYLREKIFQGWDKIITSVSLSV